MHCFPVHETITTDIHTCTHIARSFLYGWHANFWDILYNLCLPGLPLMSANLGLSLSLPPLMLIFEWLSLVSGYPDLRLSLPSLLFALKWLLLSCSNISNNLVTHPSVKPELLHFFVWSWFTVVFKEKLVRLSWGYHEASQHTLANT